MNNISKINFSTFIVNKEIVERNILKIKNKALKNQVDFRPHFKTHQSIEISELFRKHEIDKITVSSLRMAETFANNGWNDILVAFIANIREEDLIKKLSNKINLSLVVDDFNTLIFLENLNCKINIYIKVDAGYNRTGISYRNYKEIGTIINHIEKSKSLYFSGVLSHFGNLYNCIGEDEVRVEYFKSINLLLELKKSLKLDFNISVGDTPSMSLLDDYGFVNEVRPGNFVYYDIMQLKIGSCNFDEIACVMACPVVSKNIERNEVVIYGGAVHLSKEKIIYNNNDVYGIPVKLYNDLTWSDLYANSYVDRLSQEHAVIKTTKKYIDKINIGDLIGIIPVHSCLTADLNKETTIYI